MTQHDPQVQVQRIVAFFEGLKPGDIEAMSSVYTADARFTDPFNDVHGVAGIGRVFRHMFDTLDEPRFVVRERVVQAGPDGVRCFLTWDFLFRFRRHVRGAQTIHGGSLLLLAPDGRIAVHRDYWDAAQELYEKLPLLGGLMRWLRRRAG